MKPIAIVKHLRKNDIALIVTYGTSNKDYAHVMRNLQNSDGQIIVITADRNSLLSKNSDCLLIIPDEEKKHKV